MHHSLYIFKKVNASILKHLNIACNPLDLLFCLHLLCASNVLLKKMYIEHINKRKSFSEKFHIPLTKKITKYLENIFSPSFFIIRRKPFEANRPKKNNTVKSVLFHHLFYAQLLLTI